MAFSKLGQFGIDKSDLTRWVGTQEALAFNKELIDMKEQAFRRLMKDGAVSHDKNSATYSAYEKILKLFEEAKNL
jgi:hypothetical protein